MYFYTIISCGLIGLIVFVIYLWQKSVRSETKRLYMFIDDIFDRVNSDNLESYAMVRRIKHDILVQTQNVPQSTDKTVKEKLEEPKGPPLFVQQGR